MLTFLGPVMIADAVPGMTHSGTPAGITATFDCKAREAAWKFGKTLLPARGDFTTLFDALQLQACGLPRPAALDEYSPPTFATPKGSLYVDVNGDDKNEGTKAAPLRTLEAAIAAARGKANTTIVLREGVHRVPRTLNVGYEHANLTLQNYNGERAALSGAAALTIPAEAWKQHTIGSGKWVVHAGMNQVYNRAVGGGDLGPVRYLGTASDADECQSKASSAGALVGFAYHDESMAGFEKQCFGIERDGFTWDPTPEAGVTSGYLDIRNTWVADISALGLTDQIIGLRRNGRRAIRARFPNGHPERSGDWLIGAGQSMGGGDYTRGWVTLDKQTEWVAPARQPDPLEAVATNADWPGVEWPAYQGDQDGQGDMGTFRIGIGGYCQQDLTDPIAGPSGYWCSNYPARGQCWDPATNKGSGCTQTHMSPDGVVSARARGYAGGGKDAEVVAWRGGGRWFTQRWRVTGFNASSDTLLFDPTTGGQGGEGMTSASQWYIENVLEECDSDDEFFHDVAAGKLYYNFNSTSGERPSEPQLWEVTTTKVLLSQQGTQERPAVGLTVRGLTLQDTLRVGLDPHGMPSGGDWALQRSGAIFLQGTEGATISDCLLTQLDGSAVFLSGYNRNATLANNEVSWVGDNAFAAWGATSKCLNANCSVTLPFAVGPDGRGGEQPRFTTVSGNLVREIGLFQKQSSMWFQAVTAQTTLYGNVHFNGPRAGINFNDGFGGGDVVERNLLTNTVRESGDHGPVNSWDRVPYITTVRTGRPSVIPAWRHLRRNLMMSVYASQEAIDTDDGSSYYKAYRNFFIYASAGLKSDFNGHDTQAYDNVYGYVSDCWGPAGQMWLLTGMRNVFRDNLCVANADDGGFASDCVKPANATISGNTIFNRAGKLSVNICDATNVVKPLPSDDEVIAMGLKVIA